MKTIKSLLNESKERNNLEGLEYSITTLIRDIQWCKYTNKAIEKGTRWDEIPKGLIKFKQMKLKKLVKEYQNK